jgi:hypothetical protein
MQPLVRKCTKEYELHYGPKHFALWAERQRKTARIAALDPHEWDTSRAYDEIWEWEQKEEAKIIDEEKEVEREKIIYEAHWELRSIYSEFHEEWEKEQEQKRLIQEAKEEEARKREQEREAREQERVDEKAQKQREKEAKEQAERDRLQKEWDEAHAPAVLPIIEEAHWYSHCLLLAQTRFGKTNVIRWRLVELLRYVSRGEASVILMEPKGVLTEQLLTWIVTWKVFRDRIVILDPKDTRVSVNIFDKGDGSDNAIEQTLARVERVLNTVTTSLTQFQLDVLTYALRAMFYVDQPGSMRLLTKILRTGLKGLTLRNLPHRVQEFFATDFKPGDGSAQQVITRMNSLVSNPIFEALFDADRSTFNMHEEMQAGKIIVINASASNQLYARFWIEQVAATITPRFDILKRGGKLMPTTFIIDEAQTWISEDLHFASILDKAAEAKIGMLIACHHMNQIKDLQVRGSIYTNTALKFAARTTEDITHLCGSMGLTEPDFVRTLPKYEFAYFGLDMDKAIKAKFPLVEIDRYPRMSDIQYQQLRADNRAKYNYVPSTAAPATPTPEPAPQKVSTPPSVTEQSDDYDAGYDGYDDNYTLMDPTPESVRLFLQSDVAEATKMNFQRNPEQTFRIIEYGLGIPHRMKHVYANYLALIQSLNNPALLKTFLERCRQFAPQQSDPKKPKRTPNPATAQEPKSPPGPKPELELDEHE